MYIKALKLMLSHKNKRRNNIEFSNALTSAVNASLLCCNIDGSIERSKANIGDHTPSKSPRFVVIEQTPQHIRDCCDYYDNLNKSQ